MRGKMTKKEYLKNPRATLQFPMKAGSTEMKHLLEAEKHLRLAGVCFDTSCSSEGIRDWELDWSLKNANLNYVCEAD